MRFRFRCLCSRPFLGEGDLLACGEGSRETESQRVTVCLVLGANSLGRRSRETESQNVTVGPFL